MKQYAVLIAMPTISYISANNPREAQRRANAIIEATDGVAIDASLSCHPHLLSIVEVKDDYRDEQPANFRGPGPHGPDAA